MFLFVVTLIFALIIAIIAVIFAIYNPGTIDIIFLVWEFEASKTAVLLATFGAGALAMLIMLLPGIIKTRIALASQNKKVKELEKAMPKLDLDTLEPVDDPKAKKRQSKRKAKRQAASQKTEVPEPVLESKFEPEKVKPEVVEPFSGLEEKSESKPDDTPPLIRRDET